MDLSDADGRTRCAERLGALYRGRRVVHGPRVLAAVVNEIGMVATHGAVSSLVLATVRGAGEIPPEDAAHVVWLPHRVFESVTEELRQEDARVRRLPDDVAAEVEAFDPDREALWMGTPFVTSDEPILGRRVLGGRPIAWLSLEDKIAAEDVWVRAGVVHAPSEIVPVDAAALAAASQRLDRGEGTVWAGDNRDGFNGGGNFVRWVTDARGARGRYRLLRQPLRPGAGAALPRRGAVQHPRLRHRRRHRRVPSGGDRDAAARRGTPVRLRRPLDLLGPAGRRPRGDAGRRTTRRGAPARTRRLPRASSASTAC